MVPSSRIIRRKAEDIGENLVGPYQRYVERCEFVVCNTQYPGIRGEIERASAR